MIDDAYARIILLTHEVKESAMQAALEDIRNHHSTREISNVIRVFK